ncbi:hypothetical protein MUK42_17938 [Musa troglodytarum]|uniref:RING-CH-type domain-containing protein n=1 Tax=Musa troglodytarum TaxID=320322 RepID=A0A9E7KVP3_9LILI|nr:hypothetical protein MUK42_17938 [Musa troglodytarum]
MEFGVRQETRLLVDEGLAAASSAYLPPFASTCLCRICHEEEEESSSSMETPCACSGTLKFAHRECIQRWCDQKGSNVCEICLQVFEPGYTVPEKKASVDVAVTIRESLEPSRINYDPENPGFITVTDDAAGPGYPVCSPGSHGCASCCRSVAITVFLLRASGILLPFYVVMWLISAVQQAQKQYQLEQLHRGVNLLIDGMEEDERKHSLGFCGHRAGGSDLCANGRAQTGESCLDSGSRAAPNRADESEDSVQPKPLQLTHHWLEDTGPATRTPGFSLLFPFGGTRTPRASVACTPPPISTLPLGPSRQ